MLPITNDVVVVAVARVPFDTIKMENYYLEFEVCPIAMNDDVKWWWFNRYIHTTNEMRQHPTDDGWSKMREQKYRRFFFFRFVRWMALIILCVCVLISCCQFATIWHGWNIMHTFAEKANKRHIWPFHCSIECEIGVETQMPCVRKIYNNNKHAFWVFVGATGDY